jgi:hypothetical protein
VLGGIAAIYLYNSYKGRKKPQQKKPAQPVSSKKK